MIYPKAEALLETFAQEKFLEEHRAVLIGGTAIAYQLQHRMSFDLDIVFPFAETLPELTFLVQYPAKELPFDPGIIDEVINEGGEIEDYHQRYSIHGVKVDFVVNPGSNIYEDAILKEDNSVKHGTLNIASLDALFALKSLLILDRNKIRDWYDLVYLIRYGGFSAKAILETINQYRITYQNEDIIRLLSSRQPDELDIETEGIMHPKMELSDYKNLKTYLLQAISEE